MHFLLYGGPSSATFEFSGLVAVVGADGVEQPLLVQKDSELIQQKHYHLFHLRILVFVLYQLQRLLVEQVFLVNLRLHHFSFVCCTYGFWEDMVLS